MSLPMVNPRAALIFNPRAGGQLDLPRARPVLERAFSLTLYEVAPGRSPEACAREALADGAQLVIAAGGDGTVSSVAAALIGREAVLGVLPCGTANSFAAALEIPDAAEQALETLLEGESVAIDSAVANGRPMILHASLGFHAAVVAGTPTDSKSRLGVFAYLATALATLPRSASFAVHIEADTHHFECRANNITVASLAPAQTLLAQGPTLLLPDDGTLDVTLVAADGLAQAVATGVHLLRAASAGEAATRENIGYFSCRRVRIETEPAQPLLVDGEDAGSGQLEVECIPSSLRVKVPRGAAWRTKLASPESKLHGLPALRMKRS